MFCVWQLQRISNEQIGIRLRAQILFVEWLTFCAFSYHTCMNTIYILHYVGNIYWEISCKDWDIRKQIIIHISEISPTKSNKYHQLR